MRDTWCLFKNFLSFFLFTSPQTGKTTFPKRTLLIWYQLKTPLFVFKQVSKSCRLLRSLSFRPCKVYTVCFC
uniref:Secreted protein n=1 Tax=Octopus bimaculoides TaxID=37653 RepID=A0A0L8I3N8_OCTBM